MQSQSVLLTLSKTQIRTFPDTILGLATGSSPVGLYKELIIRHQKHGLSFSQVRSFNLDEYVGIPADHPPELSNLHERKPVR